MQPFSADCSDTALTPLEDPVGALVRVLREGATPTTPCFLSYHQRWRWLMDSLLGHPLIRGHQRPRDFPTDPAARQILSTAAALQKLPLESWLRDPLPITCGPTLGGWSYAFAVVVEGILLERPEDQESVIQEALSWALWAILRATGQVSSYRPACQRLLGALGLTLNDVPLLFNPDNETITREPLSHGGTFCWAAEAALMAAATATQEESGLVSGNRHNKKHVDALLDAPLWLVSLKPAEVQAFLNRANKLWLARGASAWVSQVMGFAREGLVRLSEKRDPRAQGLLLVTDVDALTEFLTFAEPSCEDLFRALKEHFIELWSEEQILTARMPRLAAMGRQLGVSPADLQARLYSLPRFRVEVSNPLSLRQLCERRPSLTKAELEKQKEEREGSQRFTWKPEPPVFTGDPCSWVEGDWGRLRLKEVSWAKGERDNPMIGWSAMAWSLAGPTYRLLALQGLGESLGRRDLAIHLDHGRWKEALHESQSPHVYLKLDGDGVGEALGTMPKLLASSAGLDMLLHLQGGLQAGLHRVVEAWQRNHPELQLTTLPLDLLYLGGDDLACSLPLAYLDDFLAGFESTARSSGARTFTAVALQIPPQFPKEESQRAPRLLQKLLRHAKAHTHGTALPGSNLALCRAIHREGFALALPNPPKRVGQGLSVWTFILEPGPAVEPCLVNCAEQFATTAHGTLGQLRNYTGDPYRAHLDGVVRWTRQATHCTEEMVAAAWLHDTLEDVPTVTPKVLEDTFGTQVAKLVQELTDVSGPQDGNRKARKMLDRAHIALASAEAQTIKLADLLDNAESILVHDPAFAPTFLTEMGLLLEVLGKGDPELHRRATEVRRSGRL